VAPDQAVAEDVDMAFNDEAGAEEPGVPSEGHAEHSSDEDSEMESDADDEPDTPAPHGEGLDCALAVAGFPVSQMVTVCDRLHAFDLGLIKFLVKLLSLYSDQQQLSARARAVPHFPGVKHWAKFSAQLSAGHLQGHEFRDILKILVYLSFRLKWKSGELSVGKRRKYCLPEDFSNNFTRAVVLFAQFYELSVLAEHTDETLARMTALCNQCRSFWNAHLLPLSPSKMNFVKFHFMEHSALQIRLFGAGDLCNVEQMESMHRDPKAMYRVFNKNVLLQEIFTTNQTVLLPEHANGKGRQLPKLHQCSSVLFGDVQPTRCK